MKVSDLQSFLIVGSIDSVLLTTFLLPVLELCGGDLADLSGFEKLKRSDMQFQVVDEREYDEADDDDDGAIEIEIEIEEDDDDNFLQWVS